jgi:hypothetical protein
VLGGIAIWVGCYALELLLDDRLLSVWMHRLMYVGVAVTPPSMLLVALEARGQRPGRFGERLLRALLLPIPLGTVLLSVTNDHQALFWAPGEDLQIGSLTPLGTVLGPWFWVHTAFSYAQSAAAFAMLARHLGKRVSSKRSSCSSPSWFPGS